MDLVGVVKITKVFAIDDLGLIGNSDAASWEYSVVDGLGEEIVQFCPIWR